MSSHSRSRSPSRGRTRTRSLTRERSRSPHSREHPMSRSRSSRRNGRRSRSYTRSPTPQPRNTKIIVEKLTKNINESHLREIFGQYGPIATVDLPLNRQCTCGFNRSSLRPDSYWNAVMTNRGTAYIIFRYQEDAEVAFAKMHGAQVDGTSINVSIVLPKDDFSPPLPPSRRPREQQDQYHRPPPPFDDREYLPRHRSPPYRGPDFRRPPPYRSSHDTYIPPRTRNRSRSPIRDSRSPSPHRRYRSRDAPRSRRRTPPRRNRGGSDEARSRRSVSYSDYDSYSDRSRSRSRGGGSRR